MPYAASLAPSEDAILQINSLGGPPLPSGVTTAALKIILENRRASQTPSVARLIASELAIRK